MRSATKAGIGRDPDYLKFIRRQPCCVPMCDSAGPFAYMAISRVEAHHAGEHGLSQKADDQTAIPLCGWHHLHGPFAIHRMGKKFWEHHGLDCGELIAELNETYEAESAAAADDGKYEAADNAYTADFEESL